MRAAAVFYSVLAALLMGALPLSEASAEGRIAWRLENPFRLFRKPEHTQLHRDIYESLSMIERQSPILAAERKLAARFGRGWADEMFNDTCYNQNTDRYDACPDYVLPKSHRIVAGLAKADSIWDLLLPDQEDGTCDWQLTGPRGAVIARKSGPCERPVTFDVPYPAGGRLAVARSGTPAAKPLDIRVRDMLVVGMGDSFGAGEGNPDHPVSLSDSRAFDYGDVGIAATSTKAKLDGYPARKGDWQALNGPEFRKERARWWDRECHRSLYSHQLRTALQLAIEDPQRAITFVSYSCSGAEIAEGILLRAPVRECTAGENFLVPSQISALSETLCKSVTRSGPMPAAIIDRMPELRSHAEKDMRVTRCETMQEDGARGPALKRPVDLLLLSVGGNDVGFVPLVSDSLLSEHSIYRTLGTQLKSVYGVDHARTRLELVKRRFEGLRYSLELFLGVSSSSGDRKVILTGYPNMGYDSDGMSACGGTKGMDVFPPFQLDATKVGKAEAFSAELNRSLASFAGRNWTYVDGFRHDFLSHGLCATSGGSPAEQLGFPRLKDNVWTPFKPSLYAAYASRTRWFRTLNDAFLITNMHADTISSFGSNCSGLYSGAIKTLARRYWTPFQVFLASTYGGAFHPTAEGQARIADEVVEAARTILDRTTN
jgi:hypothetical protein